MPAGMEGLLLRLPEIVIQLVAFAFALSVHESAHGWVAERLGDPTARWLGRITLNPIKHIDPFGTVIFPIMLAVLHAPVFGWAKPVPYVPRNLRNQRWGPAMVAVAGPGSNLAVAMVAIAVLLVLKAVLPDFRMALGTAVGGGAAQAPGVLPPLLALLFWLAAINVVLAVFNMIPVPPLDGSKLLRAVLPAGLRGAFGVLEQYGMILLFALVWTGFFGLVLRPFLVALEWILLS
jgi:Zn-dependent protease